VEHTRHAAVQAVHYSAWILGGLVLAGGLGLCLGAGIMVALDLRYNYGLRPWAGGPRRWLRWGARTRAVQMAIRALVCQPEYAEWPLDLVAMEAAQRLGEPPLLGLLVLERDASVPPSPREQSARLRDPRHRGSPAPP